MRSFPMGLTLAAKRTMCRVEAWSPMLTRLWCTSSELYCGVNRWSVGCNTITAWLIMSSYIIYKIRHFMGYWGIFIHHTSIEHYIYPKSTSKNIKWDLRFSQRHWYMLQAFNSHTSYPFHTIQRLILHIWDSPSSFILIYPWACPGFHPIYLSPSCLCYFLHTPQPSHTAYF